MSKGEDETLKPVVCVLCSREYVSVMSRTQGLKCASVLIDGRLTCHYGSDHDFEQWTWVNAETKPEKMIDPICDLCIDRWIEQGLIKSEGHYSWWDPFNTGTGSNSGANPLRRNVRR